MSLAEAFKKDLKKNKKTDLIKGEKKFLLDLLNKCADPFGLDLYYIRKILLSNCIDENYILKIQNEIYNQYPEHIFTNLYPFKEYKQINWLFSKKIYSTNIWSKYLELYQHNKKAILGFKSPVGYLFLLTSLPESGIAFPRVVIPTNTDLGIYNISIVPLETLIEIYTKA